MRLPISFSGTRLPFITGQTRSQGIREIRRVLRPGGQFFLSDIAPLPFFLRFVNRGHGHLRTRHEVRTMFEQAGLEVQAQRRLMLGHILVTSGIRREMTGCIPDDVAGLFF